MMQGSETPPFRSLFNGWSAVLAGEGPRKGSITNRKGSTAKGSVLGTGGLNRKMSERKRSVQIGGLTTTTYDPQRSPTSSPTSKTREELEGAAGYQARSGSVLTNAAKSLAHTQPPASVVLAPSKAVLITFWNMTSRSLSEVLKAL